MVMLVIGEHRAPIWTLLQSVLGNEVGIELWNEDPKTFSLRRDLDAFIVINLFAYERLGYPFGPTGLSRVLSTNGDPNMPPWIVTTPSFAARLEIDDSEQARTVLISPPLSPCEEIYEVFAKVFGAIEEFNHISEPAKIKRVGCDLEFIRVPMARAEAEMLCEIDSIGRAFREHASRTPSP